MIAQPYPAYRDTGVEWIGSVPSHWQTTRLNALFREVSEPSSDELPVLSVSIRSGVSDTELADEEMDRVFARSEDRSKYKRVEPNDLVYNMMRAWQGGFGTVQTRGAVSPAYVVARPTSSQSTAFVERLLRTPKAVGEMKRLSKGVTDFRLRLYWDEFKSIKIALPPPDEQVAINTFLDRETAKIDALVEAQGLLIALLKEKRQAVISHAVTKSLAPCIPMKDSGVEWLGQVPAHWEISQSRRMFAVRNEPALNDDRMLTASQKYGVLYQSDFVEMEGRRVVEVIMGKDSLKHVEPDDFIISMRSFQGGLERSHLRGSTSFHYVMVTPVKWVHPPFFAHLFKSIPYIQALRATTDLIRDGQEIRYSHFAKVPLPVIPIEEQVEIADFLNGRIDRYDGLIEKSEGYVALLKERRAALISAAVTGKIDVRGLVERAEAA